MAVIDDLSTGRRENVLEPSLDAMGSITPLADGIGKTVAWFRARPR